MAADMNRHAILHRLGIAEQRTEIEMLAMEARNILTPACAHRLNGLIRAGAAGMEIKPQRIEFLLEPSRADAQDHTAARKQVERGDLLGEIQWMALRQDHHPGGE